MTAALFLTAGPACAQSADELLEKGREAFLDYRFSEASRLYSQAHRKSKRTDEEFADKYAEYHRQLTDAENFLERVEKLVIIDSISVPRTEFFRSYRLPQSAGSLRGREGLPEHFSADMPSPAEETDYVFTNEGEDYKLWAEPDTTGYMHLVESTRLTDGTWSAPAPLSENLSEESDAIYPFMMADGVTLYYAVNGENSIGGYDIMIATRDASDGTFLQPSNLGFPYNSPYDDYMLAIDELNGVGWWATDRNCLDDELTVYVFIVNDLRTNYNPDDERITEYARISDYIMTQPEDSDYTDLLTEIRGIDPTARQKEAEFTLPLPGGKTVHRFDELPNPESRMAMRAYLDAAAGLADDERTLTAKRKEYNRTHSASTAREIGRLEQTIERTRRETARLRSELYKAL